MTRALLALLIVIAPLVAAAQPRPSKPPRIGFLWTASGKEVTSYRDAFAEGLRQLGHVEGRDLTIDHRYAEGRLDTLPPLAVPGDPVGA